MRKRLGRHVIHFPMRKARSTLYTEGYAAGLEAAIGIDCPYGGLGTDYDKGLMAGWYAYAKAIRALDKQKD